MATLDISSLDADRDPIDVMAESFLERLRRGERPSIDEYAAKYPELAVEVRQLLPALVQLERDLSVAEGATGSCRSAPSATTLRGAPRQLGDYTILREVGRGGMGVVYEAVQQSLGRHVALKVLPWEVVGDSSYLERFRMESRSAARMHHTNIVPVFGVGEADGVHYYAMQFIRGQGLDAVIDELRRLRGGEPAPAGEAGAGETQAAADARCLVIGRPLPPDPVGGEATLDVPAGDTSPPAADAESQLQDRASVLTSHTELTGAHDRRYYRQVARLALQVAEGLAYAHDQGVLHRDIKPSNLLVDSRGTVWITDFGLAKAEGSDGPTRTGDIVGTLRYMAPERFEGRSDRRSDLYALGATLYELLTLQPLFGEVGRPQLVDSVLHEPPTPPRRLDRHVPRDLETIVLKALAKEPGHRYRDAEAMAADLRRFIDDRPILTRRVSTTEQVWRWCRRNPALAGLTAFALLLMAGGTVAASLAAAHFRRLADDEATARRRADLLARTEAEAHRLARRRETEAQAARAEADARAQEARATTDFLIFDLIGAAVPGTGQGKEMTIGEALARADAKLDARFTEQPLLAAAIHHQMGDTYWMLKDVPKSEAHYRAAADLRTKHLGRDARDTLFSRHRLIVCLREVGRFDEARTIGIDVIERQRRALGPEDPDTLVTMSEVGQLLFPDSDPRAREYYRSLHEVLARVLGPESHRTLNALHFYALTFQARGDPGRTAEILRGDLELRTRSVGEVSDSVFWTAGDLFQALIFAREYDGAWAIMERFWPAMCRNLDPGHLQLDKMGWALPDLATATRDWARAEALARRVCDSLAADLGPGNRRTLHARANLARVLAAQGRTAEAIALYQDTLRARESTLGSDHPDTLPSRNDLADLYLGAGRWAEAEPLLRAALASQRRKSPPERLALAACLAALAKDLLHQQRWSEAESVVRECLAIRETAIPDVWLRFNSMSQLGGALLGQGRYSEAEPLVVSGYEGIKVREATIPPPGRPRLLEAAERVVALYEAWGKLEQAATWKKRLGLADLPPDVFARP